MATVTTQKMQLRREVRRWVQYGEGQISPQHIQNYLRTDYAKHAERMLLSDQIMESVYNYFTRCRNHILILLCVGNAHTTGVLAHFSAADCEAGIKSSDLEDVAEHKTASTHGAATVAVKRKEVNLLSGYMKLRFLSQFAATENFLCLLQRTTSVMVSLPEER